MLYEYAVEPRAIGSSWERFRYVIEKFGFDRGRLISQFPKTWFRMVYEAGANIGSVEKKRIEEALARAKRNKVVRTGRGYDPARPWFDNALTQHAISPFRAIIAVQDPGDQANVIAVDLLDELHPLMSVAHDWPVRRDAVDLAAALKLMLQSSSVVVFVDRYYDPFNARYQATLRECLKIIHASNPNAVCEVHFVEGERTPPTNAIEREAARKFRGVIPHDMSLTLFRWRERPGGEDFHARYLLTDRGGIRIDAGFSADGAHQTTDVALMDFDLSQNRRESLRREAVTFELIEPVLRVSSAGDVERL